MPKSVETDIAIFGGGIFGLWLLNRLRQAGFSALLFESHTLGGGQTYKAQGIIHGGTKYSLKGNWTDSAQTMADMPALWKDCLKGNGDINLSQVPILSPHQYLWSPSKITAKLSAWFAQVALKNQITPLAKQDYPSVFQHPQFTGEVYNLDEMVIDIPALIRELAKPNQDAIFKMSMLDEHHLQWGPQGISSIKIKTLSEDTVPLHAQRYIFAAGAGNEAIVKKLEHSEINMQRRPLHMVLAKIPFHHLLYAHCLSLGSSLPRLTITTHKTLQNELVWYLGGQLAEQGVTKDKKTQLKSAKKELETLFPWLNFSNTEMASFLIDRIEPAQPNGKRPSGSFYKALNNMIITWPTKLALAPKLANDVLAHLHTTGIHPSKNDTRALRACPIPSLAQPIWDELLCRDVR